MQEVICDSIVGLYSAPSLSLSWGLESESESSGFESESKSFASESESLKKDSSPSP